MKTLKLITIFAMIALMITMVAAQLPTIFVPRLGKK
nr:U26_MYRTX_Ta1a [Tetramorium africanum]